MSVCQHVCFVICQGLLTSSLCALRQGDKIWHITRHQLTSNARTSCMKHYPHCKLCTALCHAVAFAQVTRLHTGNSATPAERTLEHTYYSSNQNFAYSISRTHVSRSGYNTALIAFVLHIHKFASRGAYNQGLLYLLSV